MVLRRNLIITFIVVAAIAPIGFPAWENWASIVDIWNKILWLHWVIFVGVVLLTSVSALLWVFRSQGIARRSRTIGVVLSAIAIGVIIWILSTLGTIPGVAANVMLAIFTGSAVAFAFLQWANPFVPTNSGQSSSLTTTSPMPSVTNISPVQSSSPEQPATNTTRQSLSPTVGNAPQSVSSPQSAAIDFFISFAAADSEHAKWIERTLREANYSTFFAEYDIGAGANVPQELNRATALAKRTLLVLSPDYPLADHPEWAVAFFKDMSGERRKLVPVYVRKCPEQLQGVLAPIVPIDLIGRSQAEARELLLEGVQPGDKRKRQTTPPKFPGLSSGNHATGN